MPEFRSETQRDGARDTGEIEGTEPMKTYTRTRSDDEHEDPVVTAFLSFIEREMTAYPNLIVPLDKALMDYIGELVKDVKL